MTILVKMAGDQVELPHQRLQYTISTPSPRLQEGLAAFRYLAGEEAAAPLSLLQRQETMRFLRQFGHSLWQTIFPDEMWQGLPLREPLLFMPDAEWGGYPLELLHDGQDWLAGRRGVVCHAFKPEYAPPAKPDPERLLHLAAASACPLPEEGEEPLRPTMELEALREEQEWEQGGLHPRLLPHATRSALEKMLEGGADVLYLGAPSSARGLHLEGDDLAPTPYEWSTLAATMKKSGTPPMLLVLNDGVSGHHPSAAFLTARDLMLGGLPALARVRGVPHPAGEHNYLRTLLRNLKQTGDAFQSHLAAIRRLMRRHPDRWDWALFRLYTRAEPLHAQGDDGSGEEAPKERARRGFGGWNGEGPRTREHPAPLHLTPHTRLEGGSPARPLPRATPPPPPWARGMTPLRDRHVSLRKLVQALRPERPASAPLVYLGGAAGAGKTMLALEAARRLQRQYGQVLYLNGRMLAPPARWEPTQAGAGEGEPLSTVLARHLQAPTPPDDTTAAWSEALQRRLRDGMARLIILDRMEEHEGFEALCEVLKTLPPGNRALLLGREAPPLLPGERIELEPLDDAGLAAVFGQEFAGRVAARTDGLGPLLRQDLLLARLYHRMEQWPGVLELGEEEPGVGGQAGDSENFTDHSPLAARALHHALEHGMAAMGTNALRALTALALFPAMAHVETLEALSGLPAAEVGPALEELAWWGWTDRYDGGRYHALNPRLHRHVGEAMLNARTLAQYRHNWQRQARTFLQGLGGALGLRGVEGAALTPPALAWAEERCAPWSAGQVRALHRLGVEGVNLTELVFMLSGRRDAQGLEGLAVDAGVLALLPEMENAWRNLTGALWAVGQEGRDPVLSARALNLLADTLLKTGRGAQAHPLLERALDMLSASTAWPVLGGTYRLLARSSEGLGRLEQAANLWASAAELARQLGDGAALAEACQGLGRIWLHNPEAQPRAMAFLEKQSGFLHQLGDHLHSALVMRAQAEFLLRQGEVEAAQALFAEVLDQCRDLEQPRETALTRLAMADGFAAINQPDTALECYLDAVEGVGGDNLDQEAQGRVLSTICHQFEAENRPGRALEGYLMIRELLNGMGDTEALIGVLDHIGGLYFQLGDRTRSTRCYEERLQLQSALSPT